MFVDKIGTVFDIFVIVPLVLGCAWQFWRRRDFPEFYGKLMVIQLKKAKKEYQRKHIYKPLNVEIYQKLRLHSGVLFVGSAILFFCVFFNASNKFFSVPDSLKRSVLSNLHQFGFFVVLAHVLVFWVCGVRGKYFRYVFFIDERCKEDAQIRWICGVLGYRVLCDVSCFCTCV
ncbi:hypothetical protein FACS1894198_4080 [Clostridia bacterium]|nr:hypothetical protein FACS1894198_4080 [Clostridia bacterium]